jgi:hypothetical protein
MSISTTELAVLAVVAGGERGAVAELRELRKTVEQPRADLKEAREDGARWRVLLESRQRELADPADEPDEPEDPSYQQLQAEWLAHPAGNVEPHENAWARSIVEGEWDYVRHMNDRVVEDYGS